MLVLAFKGTLQINVIFAGHYATETLGIKTLMKHLKNQFSVTTEFIDMPTGF
jgi:putative NIF3 family GTP cyclohydrolase 1 type 2